LARRLPDPPGDHAPVEPDRSWPLTGSHTLAEPTGAAGGSRANPTNDLPDATTSQQHRPDTPQL